MDLWCGARAGRVGTAETRRAIAGGRWRVRGVSACERYSRTDFVFSWHSMLCRYKELAQQIFQEDDVRSVPETYGDRAVGLTRYDNFEELRRSGEVRQQNVLRVRRQRLRQGEVTKNRENIVFRRRERSFHPSAAELQQRVSLE